MNKFQYRKLNRLKGIIDFFTKRRASFHNDKRLVEIVSELTKIQDDLACINAHSYRNDLKVATKKKSDVRKQLVAFVLDLRASMQYWGYYRNFQPFIEISKWKSTQIKRMDVVNLLLRCEKLQEVMANYPRETDEAGITREDRYGFAGCIRNFQSTLNDQQEVVGQGGLRSEKIHQLLDRASMLLRNVLSPYMRKAYGRNNSILYKCFQTVCEEQANRHQALVLTGRFINGQTGKPLSRVKVRIDRRVATLRGSREGNYRIYGVFSGVHRIRFSKKGFQSVFWEGILSTDFPEEMDIVFRPLEEEATVKGARDKERSNGNKDQE